MTSAGGELEMLAVATRFGRAGVVVKRAVLNVNLQRNTAGRGCFHQAGKKDLLKTSYF